MIPKPIKNMGQRGREFSTWAAMCVGYGVRTYVELGSWDGSSAVFMRKSGVEKVVTVDITNDIPGALMHTDVRWVHGDSHDVDTLHKVVDILGGYPDAVFIDADHEGDAPRKDFDLWWPVTQKLLGFHDIHELEGVRRVWDEVSKVNRSVEIISKDTKSWREFHHNSEIWGRIGVLFKEHEC